MHIPGGRRSVQYNILNALRAYPATVPTTQYPDRSMCPDVFAVNFRGGAVAHYPGEAFANLPGPAIANF